MRVTHNADWNGGAPALLVTGAFLVWFYGRARDAWSQKTVSSSDVYLRRAASLTVGLLLLHALVDYALRAHAIMTLFAVCCALLLPAPGEAEKSAAPRRDGVKKSRAPQRAASAAS